MADFLCPLCKAPVKAGSQRPSQCPHCGQQLLIEVPNAGDTPTPIFDHPMPRVMPRASTIEWGQTRAAWQPVYSGLTLWIWGSVLYGLLRLGSYLYILLDVLGLQPNTGLQRVSHLSLAVGLALVGLAILGGVLLFCAAPGEARMRSWALLFLGNLMVPVAAVYLCWDTNAGSDLMQVLKRKMADSDLLAAFVLLWAVLLPVWPMQMLRALIRSGDEAVPASHVITLFTVLFAFYACFLIGVSLARAIQHPSITIPFLLVTCGGCEQLASLCFVIWWVRLLGMVRDTVPAPPENA